MAKKHYKIEFILEAPLPVKFVYREEANAFRAALGRAAARFREDIPGKPVRDLTIKLRLKDIIDGLEGRPDDAPDSDDLDADDAGTSSPKNGMEVNIGPKKPKTKPKKEETEEEEEDEEDEEDDVEDDVDDVEEDSTEEDSDDEDDVEEEGMVYEDLIIAIRKAKNKKELDKLIEKYVSPYEWSVKEAKSFDAEAARVKDSWEENDDEEEKDDKKAPPAKKAPGKSAFDSVMAMAGKKK